jgi:hypothetical protein
MQRFALKSHLHYQNIKNQGLIDAEKSESARNVMTNYGELKKLLEKVKESIGRRIKWIK